MFRSLTCCLVQLSLGAALFCPAQGWGASGRQANLTLALPQNPPLFGFTYEPAFTGLDFDRPIAIAIPPGETHRVFVLERAGVVRLVTLLPQPISSGFLDIQSRVDPSDEGGLLGMAFHPGFATNGTFFLFYTLATNSPAGEGFHSRLSRFSVDPTNPELALAESEQPLFSQLKSAANHNGGDIHFGPDGCLYVSLGDGGGGGDTYENSQRIDKDFFSAILRLDVDLRPGSLAPHPHPAIHTNATGQAFYAVPPDNPYVGATQFNGADINPGAVRTEFWAVGFRNPWRFSFDPPTGRMYCGDVGEAEFEEVDIVAKGGNYGWNYVEGTNAYAGSPPPGTVLQPPILTYPHFGGDPIPGGVAQGHSVIGGVVYRGDRLAQIDGYYVFGDGSGLVFALYHDGTQASGLRQLTLAPSPVSFGLDPSNGDVLFAGMNEGNIFRLIANTNEFQGTPLPPTLADTGAFSDLDTLTVHPGILPYDINVPFWSDHALKSRWFSIPDVTDTMQFHPDGNWSFPEGTVWIKHFEMEMTNGIAASARRLETRFLVRYPSGVYGLTYRWNQAQDNALLLPAEGMTEELVIRQPDGSVARTQTWSYPSRSQCIQCHSRVAGFALGFNTPQLNRVVDLDGTQTNQLTCLQQTGYFDAPVPDPLTLPLAARHDDASFSLERRVRSYLFANCVQCHQPGGAALGNWDARLSTPLDQAGLIDGPLVNNFGNPSLRVIAPRDLDHSALLQRISIRGAGQMPPLASSVLDSNALDLLRAWITTTAADAGPIVLVPSDPVPYGPGFGQVLLSASASIVDFDPGNFGSGTLTVRVSQNPAFSDRFMVRHQGFEPGQVGVSGEVVFHGGVAVGLQSGGDDGLTPLRLVFNNNTSLDAANAVLRNLLYEDLAPEGFSYRTVELTVSDGDAHFSPPASLLVLGSNGPPSFSDIPDQVVAEDGVLGPVAFAVVDRETDPALITVTAASSNRALVPKENIQIEGQGANRSLTLQPLPGATGTTVITLTAHDGLFSSDTSFLVTVVAINDAPSLGALVDQVTLEDTATAPQPLVVTDSDTPPAALTFSAASSNPVLVLSTGFLFGGSGTNRTLSVIPSTNQFGSATITVTVSDGSLSSSKAFLLTVDPVNDAPTMAPLPDVTAHVDENIGPLPLLIADVDTPLQDLQLSGVSSNPDLVDNDGIQFALTGDGWTVAIVPVPQATGTTDVTLTVEDNGLADSIQFEVTVALPAEPPPTLHLQEVAPNGAVTLEVLGQPDQDYVIESSQDLEEWDELDTVSSPTGTSLYTDQQAANLPRRFYRLRVPTGP